jgi:ATP/maltotriose-dependent transcriptional regulator MalT
MERYGDGESTWLAECLEGMARAKVELGDVDEGAAYLERAIRIYEKSGKVGIDYLADRRAILANLKQKQTGPQAWLKKESDSDKDDSIH